MRSAYAWLALAQLAIGAAAIFARFALAGGGPIAVGGLRLAIAALPVALVAASRGAYRRYDPRTEGALVLAGLALAAHFACWIASLQHASVAVATLLVCTTPIWTEAIAIARGRRLRLDVLASVACALVGVAIVVGAPGRSETPLGIGLALAGALAIAIYLVLVRSCDPRYGTLAVVARTYPAGASALLLAALLSGDRFPAGTDLRAWGGVAAMALISQLFGHTALNAAVRRLSATFVATVTLIEPFVAGLLAALVFGERLAPASLAGAVVVLIGIGIAIRADPAGTETASTPSELNV